MQQKEKISLSQIIPLYLVIFLGYFGYALTIALFIPMLLDTNQGLLAATSTIAIRTTTAGFLLAMYPLGQFIGSPIIGKLSDHFGRKKVLIISLICCVIGFAGMAFNIATNSLTILFISCFVTGLCESNMAISQSVIADNIHDPITKNKLIGYAYSICSFGYIMGPLVGGFSAGHHDYSFPFWLTAAAIIPLTVWISCKFKDSHQPKSKVKINLLESLTSMQTIFNKPQLRFYYLINFIIFFAILGLYRVTPIYVVDKWHPDLHVYTLLISFVSLLCLIANLFFIGTLAKIFMIKNLLTGLLIFSSIFIFLIVIPQNFHWIWLTYGLAMIPTVMALTTCTTWLSSKADSSEQGQVLGNNQALLVLGEASSAAIGGLVAAINIALPIIAIGGILLIASYLIITKKK